MNRHADPIQKNRSGAIAPIASPQSSENAPAFQFADHRPSAIAQRKLQKDINNSPRVKQLGAYQAMADHSAGRTAQRKANNTGLPDNLKSGIEQLSGHSMDDVKVHYNSARPAQLQAHAYAQGTDIHIASGQEKHLPHEAWHVVQQKQSRVKTTLQMKGKLNVNDDAGLEREADRMGARALQMKASAGNANPTGKLSRRNTPLNVVTQMVKFMKVKRIAAHGSMYMGRSVAGAPNLAHGGGNNWWGSKATANVYATPPGAMWEARATTALNLVDMGTAKSVRTAMQETIRRSGGLSAALVAILGNFDFAYAIPVAVANIAKMCLRYGTAEFAVAHSGVWTANPYVTQLQVDNSLLLAANAAQVPQMVGTVIQTFADHNSGNAVRLDNAAFLANPAGYKVLRKDNTATDVAFAVALLQDLNNPAMFHGLHVPAGMKFAGYTGTIQEILIHNSPVNLALQALPRVLGGPEPDLHLSDKTLGVDDSKLARAWRYMGGNS